MQLGTLEAWLEEPEQGSGEAIYVSAMVGEMMQRVLEDALIDLARTRGAAYLDMFVERELARSADLFRERPDDTPKTSSMLRAWFVMEGSAALRAVVERASAEAARD
ncbi:hypothetical protein ACRAWG_27875 [Methylobacterium sp. P31]